MMSPTNKAFYLLVSMSCVGLGCAHPRATHQTTEVQRAPASRVLPALPSSEQVSATAAYHFAMAQAYSAEGNPDRAIEEYKLTLMYDPKASIVHARLATEYVKKGMASAAMETCKEALALDAGANDARMILASLYSSAQQYDEAVSHYSIVLKSDPSNEEAAVYKAQAQLDQEKNAEAIETMKAFVKDNGDSALGWYYLGRTYHKSGNFDGAEKSYRKAIDVKPSLKQALLSLGYMYEEGKKNDRAVAVYREVYDDTQDLTAANRIAMIFLKQEKYKEAIPYLEAIEASDSSDLNNQVKLGLVYMETKDYDKAVGVFLRLIEKNPDSDRIRFYLGSLHEERGDVDQAVHHYRLVPANSKLFADSILHAANLLRGQGKNAEAKLEVNTAISKSPETPNFYVFLASVEEEENDLAGAIKTLERAYGVFPREERVLYYLGSLYDRVGETQKGLAKMEQLLFVNPENADALNYLGYTWTILGEKLDTAEEYLKKAMVLRPDNAFITDSWGWHLFVRGKISEAIRVLEKAVALKGDEATILEHLADAYARANLPEKAFVTYQKALAVVKDAKEREKLMAKVESAKAVLAQAGRTPAGRTAATRRPASVTPSE
jgi:tetratricopeptide (TPR) repeat protein